MDDLVDINTHYPASAKYINNFLRGNTMIVTNEFLNSSNVLDIGSITISSEDYINKSKNHTQDIYQQLYTKNAIYQGLVLIKIRYG